MKRHYLGIIALGALGLQNVYAEDIKANENDTIKTYNMGEVIVTSSTKETNNLRTLPGSVSILSPQMISGRQIDALKDISSFVPNLYMPDYGAKLTSAIYIRGIGARSSGQSTMSIRMIKVTPYYARNYPIIWNWPIYMAIYSGWGLLSIIRRM